MIKKKKICFLMLGNIYLHPYLEKYTQTIDCEYDIVYWNRHNLEEKTKAQNQYEFNYFLDEGKNKINKLFGYVKFRKFAKKALLRTYYDGVILLTTSMGIILIDILIKKYCRKYIADIRDYTLEKNLIFYTLEKKLINNSNFTIISSNGYLKFLPKHANYVLMHNNPNVNEKNLHKFLTKNKNPRTPIVISYIGLIRFHNQNKRIIDMFGGDKRFILRFIGKDAFALSEYCEEKMFMNVELIDWFPPEKTLDYFYETDMICNLYGNHTLHLDYALSNKLYYAAKLHIPILICPDTYMAEINQEYGFAYVLPLEKENEKDNLYNYFMNIDWDDFNQKCERFNRMVDEDDQLFIKNIKDFIAKI